MQQQPLLSVIVCSVDPEKYAASSENVLATSGVPTELIRIDNLTHRWPIAKAYNEGAKLAKSKCLLFLHEDVKFDKSGWGRPLIDKLSEPETGVIGFIGSDVFVDAVSPWSPSESYYGNVIMPKDDIVTVMRRHHFFPDGTMTLFEPVVTVDGLGFAVRKELWEKYPFDEKLLTAFHCYDIDYSLTMVASGYTNYAYTWGIIHFSNGSYDERWLAQTMKMLQEKWSAMLPLTVGQYTPEALDDMAAVMDYDHIFRFFRKGISKSLAREMMRRYIAKSKKSKAYRSHLYVVLYTYMRKFMFKNGKSSNR